MINIYKRSSCSRTAEITQSKRNISAGNEKYTDMQREICPSLASPSYMQLPRFIDQKAP